MKHSWVSWVPGLMIGVSLMAGFVYAARLGPTLRFPDEAEYVTLATNLVQHGCLSLDGHTPTAFRPPAYPFVLAVLAACGGGIQAFRILNVVALGLSLTLIWRLLFIHRGLVSAAAGVVLALAYPVFIYTAGTLYPQTLAATLLLAALWLVFRDAELSLGRAFLAGLAAAGLVLMAPTFLFAAGLLLIWPVLENPCRRRWSRLALSVVAAGLMFLPWTVRNRLALGAWVPLSTNSGLNLLLGNSENTEPNAGVNVDLSAYERKVIGLGEVERDRYYRNEAVRYIKAHPAESLRMYGLKFLNHFNYRNRLLTRSESSPWRVWILLVTYGFIFVLATVRVLRWRQDPFNRLERFAAVLYVLQGAFAAVCFTRIRFRVPFDFLLILLAAPILSAVWERMCGTGFPWSAGDAPPFARRKSAEAGPPPGPQRLG